MLSCAVYSTIMKYATPKFFNYRPLKEGELKKMILVSVIFIVNIVLSNSSLKFNSLALDQVLLCSYFLADVPLYHARIHLHSGIYHSSNCTPNSCIPISHSSYHWNDACMCRRCRNSKRHWLVDLRHFLRSDSSYHKLHNLGSEGNCHEISSFGTAASQHFPIIEPCTISLHFVIF